MRLVYRCPKCETSQVAGDIASTGMLSCRECGWSRAVTEEETRQGLPSRCLVCGCADLWRQKDFPARAGLLIVVIGAILSTMAWAQYRPVLAMGILMAFAAVDLVLFLIMPDVLVCYRCGGRHRDVRPDESAGRFNHELAERYRQEAARLREQSVTGDG